MFTSLPDLCSMALDLICPHVKPGLAARYLLCLHTSLYKLLVVSCTQTDHTDNNHWHSNRNFIIRALQGLVQLQCFCVGLSIMGVRMSRHQQAAVRGLKGNRMEGLNHSSCHLKHCSAHRAISAIDHSRVVSKASIHPPADTSIIGVS